MSRRAFVCARREGNEPTNAGFETRVGSTRASLGSGPETTETRFSPSRRARRASRGSGRGDVGVFVRESARAYLRHRRRAALDRGVRGGRVGGLLRHLAEPQAGSESDRCRAGKPFFREGHRLAVGRARVSARGGVGDDASAPSEDCERAGALATRPDSRSPLASPRRRTDTTCRSLRMCNRDARPTPARLNAAPDDVLDGPPAPAPPRRDARALCGGSKRTPAVAVS